MRAAVTREKRNCRASPPLFKRYATHGCQLNRLLRNPVNHELEVIIVCLCFYTTVTFVVDVIAAFVSSVFCVWLLYKQNYKPLWSNDRKCDY